LEKEGFGRTKADPEIPWVGHWMFGLVTPTQTQKKNTEKEQGLEEGQ
jgi:hypothetical protein